MVMYANKSLYHLLDIKPPNFRSSGNSGSLGSYIQNELEAEYESLKASLIETTISPYTSKI